MAQEFKANIGALNVTKLFLEHLLEHRNDHIENDIDMSTASAATNFNWYVCLGGPVLLKVQLCKHAPFAQVALDSEAEDSTWSLFGDISAG